jgi:hypothetical protein
MSPPPDLAELRLSPERKIPKRRPGAAPSGPGRTRRFLKGPVPLDWLLAVGCLPGKAMHIGVALWHQVGLCGGSPTVKLRWKLMGEFGVTRHSGYRALKALEAAGLISVVRHPGRSPVVTVCDCPLDSEGG